MSDDDDDEEEAQEVVTCEEIGLRIVDDAAKKEDNGQIIATLLDLLQGIVNDRTDKKYTKLKKSEWKPLLDSASSSTMELLRFVGYVAEGDRHFQITAPCDDPARPSTRASLAIEALRHWAPSPGILDACNFLRSCL